MKYYNILMELFEKSIIDIGDTVQNNKVIILCDGISFSINASTLIRQGAIFGASDIVFCMPTNSCNAIKNFQMENDEYKLTKTFIKNAEYHSLDYIRHIKTHYNLQTLDCIKLLQLQKYKIYTLENDTTAENIHTIKFPNENICFVVGSETNGISKQVLDLNLPCIYIPSKITSDSLNAAIACTIVLYEHSKQMSLL